MIKLGEKEMDEAIDRAIEKFRDDYIPLYDGPYDTNMPGGDLLEKAWKMPWGWGKSEDFKPVLVFNRDILQISHASDGVYNAYDYLWDFVYPKRLYTDEN